MTARGVMVVLLIGVAVPAACTRGHDPAARSAGSSPTETADDHAAEANALHLSADAVRDLRMTTAPVTERLGTQEVGALGTVAVNQDRYAEAAPPVPGQVVALLVAAQASVDRGTPLARLRSVELGRARAAIDAAQARRDLASQTFTRRQTLAAERIVAEREVQEAAASLRAAEAELQAARGELAALGIGDADTVPDDASTFIVRSPLAGRVLERRAVLGSWAAPAEAMFTIADLSDVWIVAQVFERDAVNVRPGSVAHVTLAALPGQEFDGAVTLTGRQVDPGSRTVPVRIDLPNPSGAFRPGMSASVRLEVSGQAKQVLSVPAAALQRVGERWLVFVPRGPGEFEMRAVGRGRDLGLEVEVVSGLTTGETVVVDGAYLLKAEAERKAGGIDEHGH